MTVAITATRQAAIKAGHDLLALVNRLVLSTFLVVLWLERLSADSAQDDNPVAAETVETVSWSLLVCVGVALAAR
ncbi:MAG TPA: hypothetical protein VF468_24840 [Actinomycetota bacterium]|nr:hypothetical protein [Actinomycetota bacterium]